MQGESQNHGAHDRRPIDVTAVSNKLRANFAKGDPALLALVDQVSQKYQVDMQGALDYIEGQLLTKLDQKQQSTEGPAGRRSSTATRGSENILSQSGFESWDGFAPTKEYEEMQAAQTYVEHRKKIADVVYAVKTGDVRRVISIVEANPSILEYQDQDGWTLLFHSIAAKNHLVVRWILTQDGIDCNHRDRNSLSALHWAAFNGNVNICQMIVDRKADVTRCTDRAGCTPLHMAAHEGQLGICVWFIDNYPSIITQQDRDGATPLHYAALRGQTKVLFKLIDFIREESCGAFDLCRLMDHDNANILHYAAVSGHVEAAKALYKDSPLLLLGRSKSMETPADTAHSNGHQQLSHSLMVTAESLRRAQGKEEAAGEASSDYSESEFDDLFIDSEEEVVSVSSSSTSATTEKDDEQ